MPKHNETTTGKYAWGGVAAFVVAWDMLASETMSHAFRRGIESPSSRPWLLAGLGALAAHLVLPEKYDSYDPLRQALAHLRAGIGSTEDGLVGLEIPVQAFAPEIDF